MPIYEYRCHNGHTLEVMQRISDDPLPNCTSCDAPVRRVFHPVAVHFKGSGFYTTDYRKNNAGRDSDEGKAKSGSEETSKGSSDASKASSGASRGSSAAATGASKSEGGASKPRSGSSGSNSE